MAELNDDLTPLDSDEDELLRRGGIAPLGAPSGPPKIGRPTDSVPPATLRGVTPAAPAAAQPSALDQRTAADEATLKEKQAKGSGISRLPGAARIPLRILEGLGDAVIPRTLSMIPGTEGHHQRELGQLRGQLGEDVEQQKEAAQTGNLQSESIKNQAEAIAALNRPEKTTKPEPVFDKAGNIIGFNTGTDLIGLQSKDITPDMKAIADAAQPKVQPVGDASAKQYNDSILRELNVNPKTAQKVIPPEYQVLASDSDAQAKEKLQRAKDLVSGATGQQHIQVSTGNQGTARSDKSYQLQSTRLDKLRAPVDQLATRYSRLQDTLDQRSPQADALIGPELLSVMSGGQGSGLRMNEAEISRIVGGRSAWESLKASLQHWSMNPDDARSITADQDKQIRALVATVHQKITAKQQIIQKADEDLLDSDDPKDHRRIVAEVEKQLNTIDAGGTQDNAQGGKGALTVEEAREYLQKAGGDKDKARAAAKADGRTF